LNRRQGPLLQVGTFLLLPSKPGWPLCWSFAVSFASPFIFFFFYFPSFCWPLPFRMVQEELIPLSFPATTDCLTSFPLPWTHRLQEASSRSESASTAGRHLPFPSFSQERVRRQENLPQVLCCFFLLCREFSPWCFISCLFPPTPEILHCFWAPDFFGWPLWRWLLVFFTLSGFQLCAILLRIYSGVSPPPHGGCRILSQLSEAFVLPLFSFGDRAERLPSPVFACCAFLPVFSLAGVLCKPCDFFRPPFDVFFRSQVETFFCVLGEVLLLCLVLFGVISYWVSSYTRFLFFASAVLSCRFPSPPG